MFIPDAPISQAPLVFNTLKIRKQRNNEVAPPLIVIVNSPSFMYRSLFTAVILAWSSVGIYHRQAKSPAHCASKLKFLN